MTTSKGIERVLKDVERIMKGSSDKPEEKGLIFPKVSAEQLRVLSYYATAGDMLTPVGAHHHQGSPDAVDTNGMSKREIYLAASKRDLTPFRRMVRQLNTDRQWLDLMVSQRHLIPSKTPGKKCRAIDCPSEAKRLYGLYALWHLTQVAEANRYLEDSVVGFRYLSEFPNHRKREDGITIQDVFADTVYRMISDRGNWVVFLDLADAFGGLPHKAVNNALKELGINHRERRRLIELTRIRTRTSKGQILKPHKYGIEQGNILSPMVFNLVMSHIIRRLQGEGIQGACYGDDVVLVTDSESEAHTAFGIFKQITDELGFHNVRALGTEGKSSRIYNVELIPVPLLKTFLVWKDHIDLTPEKALQLRSKLSPKPTMREIRKKNRYKSVSKLFLKSIRNIDYEDPTRPASDKDILTDPMGLSDDRYSRKGRSLIPMTLTRSTSLLDTPSRDMDLIGLPPILSDEAKSTGPGNSKFPSSSISDSTASRSTIGSDQSAGTQLIREPKNGRSAALRGGSDTGVTSGEKDVSRRGHRLLTPSPVLLEPSPEDLTLLAEGRRLRCGHQYRVPYKHKTKNQYQYVILDVRDLSAKIPPRYIPHAISQLARVSSVQGHSHMLCHPGDAWVWFEDNFPDLDRIKVQSHPLGQVWTLRRSTVQDHVKTAKTRSIPPDVDTLVLSARRYRDDSRKWSVTIKTKGKKTTKTIAVTSINKNIARLEAISRTLEDLNLGSVAIPYCALAGTCLLDRSHPKQVGLSDAIKVLLSWKWKRNGSWLVGVRK